MSTSVNPIHTSAPPSSRTSSAVNTTQAQPDPAYMNGHQHHHHHHHHDPPAANQQSAAPAGTAKKWKKKATDPNEASKLIAAKISQLELDGVAEKEQEAEIGGSILRWRIVYCRHPGAATWCLILMVSIVVHMGSPALPYAVKSVAIGFLGRQAIHVGPC